MWRLLFAVHFSKDLTDWIVVLSEAPAQPCSSLGVKGEEGFHFEI